MPRPLPPGGAVKVQGGVAARQPESALFAAVTFLLGQRAGAQLSDKGFCGVGGQKPPALPVEAVLDTRAADQVEWTLSSDTQAQGTREGTCMNLQRKPSADWEEF